MFFSGSQLHGRKTIYDYMAYLKWVKSFLPSGDWVVNNVRAVLLTMFISPSPYVTQRFIMCTFCLLQYVTFQLITETPRVKMSHCDAFRPRSVTKLHLPPCCSLCTASIHSSSMPAPASCVLLPFDLMTTPSLHHLAPPPCWSTSFPLLCFLL